MDTFVLFFSDDSFSVNHDLFFDFINFLDSKLFVTAILSKDNSNISYYVSDRDDIDFVNIDYFLNNKCLWSLVGVCRDRDEILRFKLENNY